MQQLRSSALAFTLFPMLAASAGAAEVTVSAQAGYYDVTNARRSARFVFDGIPGGATFRAGARLRFQKHIMFAVTSGYFGHAGRKALYCRLSCFTVDEESRLQIVPATAALGLTGAGKWRPYGGVGGGAAYVNHRPHFYERGASDWVSAAFILAGLERRGERFGVGVETSWLALSPGQGFVAGFCCTQRDLGGLSAMLTVTYSAGGGQ